jgi:arabinofuranan 3-O-arabinosyltransferase
VRSSVSVGESSSEESRSGPNRRGPLLTGRRMMWLLLVVVLLLLPFLSLPGRYVADTRDATWFAPGTDLTQQLSVWRSSPSLGVEQHSGIIVPMGVVIALLRGIGLPVWVTERLWHGLLLFVAGAGMVFLIDRLRGHRSVVAPLLAATVYTLTPYTFGYGLPTTAAFLPYVLLPALLYVAVRWLPKRGLVGPALIGLVSFLMGGGNGAPQVYSFVPILAFVAWAVWAQREVPLRQAVRFLGWSLMFVVGLNAYWLFSLSSSSDVTNVLAFSEQPKVINSASSFSESIRGLGFWGFYGWDRAGAWVPTVQRFITSPLLTITGFAVPVGALLSAWLVRWRYRLFFLFLAILGVVVMAGIFPEKSPTPFGHLLQLAFRKIPGAAGLRTTYKFAPTLILSLAVLAGIGLEQLLRWAGTRQWGGAKRLAIGAMALAVVLAYASPMFTGGLYASSRSATGIPAYWTDALNSIGRDDFGYRAYFAPSTNAAIYTWGRLHDGIAEATPRLYTVHPSRVPVGQHYGSDLLAALEQPYLQGVTSPGAAALFRYLGVNRVVLQNDVDWYRVDTARPSDLQLLARDPSLVDLRRFGSPGQNIGVRGLAGEPGSTPTAAELTLAPVEVLSVPNPVPVVHEEYLRPVVVSGDGFGLSAAAARGLLNDTPPVLYSGALSKDQLLRLASESPSFVITDSNRRRAWSQGGVRRNFSYTLLADQKLPGLIAYGLFNGRTDTQSVAQYDGVASITASGYGSIVGQVPALRPVNAFDGDPATAWEVGGLGNPVGSWIQAAFTAPHSISQVALTVPPSPLPGFTRQVTTVRLEFSDGSTVNAFIRAGTSTVRFPVRVTTFVRVRITGVSDATVANDVGFSEIAIPRVHVREVIRMPSDLVDTLGSTESGKALLSSAALTYLFDRARSDSPFQSDEETGISRRFEVPASRSFDVSGTLHLGSLADQQIDLLLRGPTDFTASSSSRFLGSATVRAGNAIDGDPNTAWTPQGGIGQWLKLTFPPRKLKHIRVQTSVGFGRGRITKLKVTFSDGTVQVGDVDVKGIMDLSFPKRETSAVTLTIAAVSPLSAKSPVGIAEVGVRGVRLPPLNLDQQLGCRMPYIVDGQLMSVAVEGTIGQLLRGSELSFSACGGQQLQLEQGWHGLFAFGGLQFDTMELSSPATLEASVPVAPVGLKTWVVHGGYEVDVQGATAPFYLSIGQNYSTSWRASVDGASLGIPLLLDGYSAGWRIDHQGSFVVSVRYAPQRRYDLSLAVSGLSLLGLLAVFLVPAVARPRSRPGDRRRRPKAGLRRPKFRRTRTGSRRWRLRLPSLRRRRGS